MSDEAHRYALTVQDSEGLEFESPWFLELTEADADLLRRRLTALQGAGHVAYFSLDGLPDEVTHEAEDIRTWLVEQWEDDKDREAVDAIWEDPNKKT